MESLHQFEITIILFLQSLGVWLATPLKAITALGYEEFYMLVMPALFWCLDATLGFRVAIMLLLSNAFGEALKLALHQPRPYWIDTRVTAFTAETSFGIPSGHSLNAVAIWGLVAASIRRRWIQAVMVLVIVLIGVSRIFLGVHFISDVLTGWLTGGLLLWGFLSVEKSAAAWLRKQPFNQMALLALGSSFLMIILVMIPSILLGDWQVPEVWKQNALAASPGNVIDPLAIEGVFTTAGTWFGMTLGIAWLFHSQGGYNPAGSLVQRVLRYVVGLVGVILFWYGLGLILPKDPNFLGYSLRFARYTLVGLWVSALAPLVFQRIGLAKEPEEKIPSFSTPGNPL
jgi:membrane-associated phospholipid phosphatase